MGGTSSSDQLPERNGHKYGWRQQNTDSRDHLHILSLNQLKASAKMSKIDLRNFCPPVYDQGNLGSCTANAINGAFEICLIKQDLPDFTPSRLFLYYNEREMEGTVARDAGAVLRDGIKSINRTGVCHETEWPYDTSQFAEKPPQDCYKSAKGNRALRYKSVSQRPDHIKTVLCEGFVVVFGFAVHESFEAETVAETGLVAMPGSEDDDPVLGGHAACIVGYDDEKQHFIVRNSWGALWGDEGYCYFPYELVKNADECSDFWTLQYVEEDLEIE